MIPMSIITATLLTLIYISVVVGEQCRTKVRHGRYPWFARLNIRIPGYENSRFCVGSVINNHYILTAAHCIDRANIVYVGLSYDFDNYFTAAKFIPHPLFNGSRNLPHDIVLVKLEKPMVFSKRLKPICLPPSNIDTSGDLNNDCNNWYGRRLLESHMCAGAARKGSCVGYSGGPLFKKVNGKNYVVGIVSM
ncbi:chymotrypsin-like protease CTRL-1, partial [Leptotrombidium deliense]